MISDFLPDYPYLPRLSFKGSCWFQCPGCGYITLNKINTGQYQIGCYNKPKTADGTGCRHRLYGFGMRLWPIRRDTRAGQPTDHAIVPGLVEAFPLGEMFRWRSSGQMAHQLIPGGMELVKELVRQVRSRAGVGSLKGIGSAFELVVEEWGLELDE